MNNGLQDKEYEEIRKALRMDAYNIFNVVQSNEGHLGDIVSCLRTTISSLELKANQLAKIFNEQKQKYGNETNKTKEEI